jgi:MFS family permease
MSKVNSIINRFSTNLFSNQNIPIKHQWNFKQLYFDYAWVGVINGSILAFLSIYAARLGALGWQIGLIAAIPGAVNLLFALPSGSYIESRPVKNIVFISSVLMRGFYIFLIPIPLFLNSGTQVWAIITITLIMNIPGTMLAIGFNSLLADIVPIDYRAYVAGVRNALFSLTTIITTLVCGLILNYLAFPINYQIVFSLGLIGAIFSSRNLWRIKPKILPATSIQKIQALENQVETCDNKKKTVRILRVDVLSGSFGKLMLLLFIFHLFQYLAIPIFPNYLVNQLKYSEGIISIGNGVFFLTVFWGSTRLVYLSAHLGNRKVVGIGVAMMAFYPFFIAASSTYWLYFIGSLLGGIGWALAGGAVYNYILEKANAKDLPAHLAWYNLVLNGAILIGCLIGPVIGSLIGLTIALVLYGLGRVVAGLLILRWG